MRKYRSAKKTKNSEDKYWKELHTFKGYFKYQIIFGLSMIFDGVWWQSTNVISSFQFKEIRLAATNTALQFLSITDLIGNGYGVSLSAKVSQLLA